MNIENQFNQLYHTYAFKVYKLCLGYASGNEELAKEWQQETFIKVWKHKASFKKKSSISTWIYRIAVNVCLQDLRKPKNLVPIKENIAAPYSVDEPSEKWDAQIQQMYQCIYQLTPINKAIILLELEEVPQATIAEVQGFTHGALRTRLSRIKKSLLKCITNGK